VIDEQDVAVAAQAVDVLVASRRSRSTSPSSRRISDITMRGMRLRRSMPMTMQPVSGGRPPC
jgi:hypothetical protein